MMQKYNGQLIRQFASNVSGNAASGVTVTVRRQSDSGLAILYADNNTAGATIANPITTSTTGRFSFYAADGVYTLTFSDSTPVQVVQLQDVVALQEQFDNAVSNAGYIQIGTFAAGCTVNQVNGVVSDGSSFWRWDGALPKTVTAGSAPTPAGVGNWVLISDGGLRSDLAATNSTVSVAGVDAEDLAIQYALDTLDKQSCAHIAKRLSDGFDDNLACFGDSTMYGYLVGGATPETQDPDNPPALLKKTLGHLYGYTGTVINAAISGTAMFNMMRGYDIIPNQTYEQRIAPGGIAASAVVVYCNHGINDCQSNLSVETFEQDWVNFVNITRKYGKVPVIVTCNPITPIFTGDKRESSQIEIYDNAKRRVAARMGVELVDNYYYAKKSANRYTETVLIPDGVHPSSTLYRQNGRNLALPLVSANVLRKEGDLASLSGTSYFDTQSSSIVQRDETRAGLNYVANRSASVTGINAAVILDEPFKYLSFMALHWDNGARVKVGVQDNTSPWGFPRCGKSYGNIPFYKWDNDFVVKTDALAGLNVLYWLFDITDTRPTFNASALNGFAVPMQGSKSGIVPNLITADYRKNFSLLAYQSLTVKHTFAAGSGDTLTFIDDNNLVTVEIKLTSGNDLTVTLNNQSGVVTTATIASAEPAGEKVVSLAIREDEITVAFKRVGSATFVTQNVAITNSLPPIALSLQGASFIINGV